MRCRILWIFNFFYGHFRNRVNYAMKKRNIPFQIKALPMKYSLRSTEDAHKAIRDVILKGAPALIARFGSNEVYCAALAAGVKLGLKKHIDETALDSMHYSAGLFPRTEDMAIRFSEILCESAGKVDILGHWDSNMQDYMVRTVCASQIRLTALKNLEPYYSNTPWTAALKGKKVLVIHPFKESIESQYKKRELLFDDPDMLPEFELHVLQAVQTIAGEKDDRFSDWEEALNYMYEEAMSYDFEIAIIGCGAYGMPLAAKLKESGKIAIHLGGATQLLFGIKGARWDNHVLSRLYNEHWVRPSKNEIPELSQRVEGGCYW